MGAGHLWHSLQSFFSSPLNFLLALSLFLALLALALSLLSSQRLLRLYRYHRLLWEGVDAPNLEKWVAELVVKMDEVIRRLEALEGLTKRLEEGQKRCLQNVGVIRYNAFEDVGGELSFSVALLDGHGDGVVITSLYGREESRTYAKPIKGGESPITLSVEEREAIRRARVGG